MEGIRHQARGKAHPRNLPEWQRSCQIISVEIIECFSRLPLWSAPSTSVSIVGPVLLEIEGVSDWAWPTLTSSWNCDSLQLLKEFHTRQGQRMTLLESTRLTTLPSNFWFQNHWKFQELYLHDVLHQHGNPSFALVLLLWIPQFQYKFNWRSSKMMLRLSNCIQFDWIWRIEHDLLWHHLHKIVIHCEVIEGLPRPWYSERQRYQTIRLQIIKCSSALPIWDSAPSTWRTILALSEFSVYTPITAYYVK